MKVYSYEWRSIAGDTGTGHVAIPDHVDKASLFLGFEMASGDAGVEISGWKQTPDLRKFIIPHVVRIRHDGRHCVPGCRPVADGFEYDREWEVFSPSKKMLEAEWRRKVARSAGERFSIVSFTIEEVT